MTEVNELQWTAMSTLLQRLEINARLEEVNMAHVNSVRYTRAGLAQKRRARGAMMANQQRLCCYVQNNKLDEPVVVLARSLYLQTMEVILKCGKDIELILGCIDGGQHEL